MNVNTVAMMAVLVATLSYSAGAKNGDAGTVTNGMSMQQVVDLLGHPRGTMASGGTGAFFYDNVTINIKDGVVTAVEKKQRRQARSPVVADPEPIPTAQAPESIANHQATTPSKKAPRAAGLGPEFQPVNFTRGAHPSALYFSAIPIEFDELTQPSPDGGTYELEALKSSHVARRVFKDLRDVLRRYPMEVLLKSVNCIYFASAIRRDGKSLVGFPDATQTSIYLTRAEAFHAPFARLLIGQHRPHLVAVNWGDLSTDENTILEPSTLSGEDLYQRGFINPAAMASTDADAAEIMAALHDKPASLFALADRHLLIGEKVSAIMQFTDKVYAAAGSHGGARDRDYFLRNSGGR